MKLYPTLVIRGTGTSARQRGQNTNRPNSCTGIASHVAAHPRRVMSSAPNHLRHAGLYELWRSGRYKNYPPDVLVDLVAKILALVPPWTRVYRVQRCELRAAAGAEGGVGRVRARIA